MSQETIQQPVNPQETIADDHWGEVYGRLQEVGVSADTQERADQLKAVSGQGILDMAIKLHSVLAPDIEHEPTDYAMSIAAPDGSSKRQLMQPEDRMSLFEQAASLVRGLATIRGTGGNDEAFLKRAGNIIALAVVEAHPFAEANGRTARTIGNLIREGYDGSDAAQQDYTKLGSNRPPSGYRINSYVPTRKGLEMSPGAILEAAASLDQPLSEQAAYFKASQDVFTTPYDN